MHPLLSDTRRLLWYLLLWLVAGLCIAKLLVEVELVPWGQAVLFAVPMALVYGFVAASAYYVCRSLPLARRHFFLGLVAFGATSLVCGLAWLAACQLWAKLGQALFPDAMVADLSPPTLALLLALGCGLYLLSLLAHDVLIAFENLREAQQRESESRLLARDAELQLLRTQIDPHFLFNSLNSISALTALDPAGARQMTLNLAQFFRQTLALAERDKIMLAEEQALCESFLAVEKVRFGSKLAVRWDMDGAPPQALIPPLLLQPLLENAIKHGIRNLVRGGCIHIQGLGRDNWLHLLVNNPVGPASSTGAGNGLGLKNLRARLASLYGGQARISWTQTDDTFQVQLALPLELGKPVEVLEEANHG